MRHFRLISDNMPWDGIEFDVEDDATEEQIQDEAWQWAAEHVDYQCVEIGPDGKPLL